MPFHVAGAEARSILSKTTGFIAEAGFSHSLTPARNCTYGCSYCYVPTMRIYAGLQREDWERWGQHTTFKRNAAELVRRSVHGDEVIYCSPLVDPWQPAEESEQLMPAVLTALTAHPPRLITFQTRSPRILRDLGPLLKLAARTDLRVSFSLTTTDEATRRLYEPHCEPAAERLAAIRTLPEEGIRVFATLAPLLPGDPEELAHAAISSTTENLVGDPLHVRPTKRNGATTRSAAAAIAQHHSHQHWFDPAFQNEVIERIRAVAHQHGRRFATGPEGFSWLSQISR